MSRSKSRRAAKRRAKEQPAQQSSPSRNSPAPAGVPASEAAPEPAHAPSATAAVAASEATRTAPECEEPEGFEPVALGTAGAGGVSDTDFATVAESLMRECKEQGGFRGLTTTKLRRIYALIMNVYARAGGPDEFERCKPDVQYLKVRMAYEAGREAAVREFLTTTRLMSLVDEVRGYEQFLLYCRYAEALVAYFKFYGGKDS